MTKKRMSVAIFATFLIGSCVQGYYYYDKETSEYYHELTGLNNCGKSREQVIQEIGLEVATIPSRKSDSAQLVEESSITTETPSISTSNTATAANLNTASTTLDSQANDTTQALKSEHVATSMRSGASPICSAYSAAAVGASALAVGAGTCIQKTLSAAKIAGQCSKGVGAAASLYSSKLMLNQGAARAFLGKFNPRMNLRACAIGVPVAAATKVYYDQTQEAAAAIAAAKAAEAAAAVAAAKAQVTVDSGGFKSAIHNGCHYITTHKAHTAAALGVTTLAGCVLYKYSSQIKELMGECSNKARTVVEKFFGRKNSEGEKPTPASVANAKTPVPVANAETPVPVANAETQTSVANAETPVPVANAETTVPVANAETPVPVANAKTPAVKKSLPEVNKNDASAARQVLSARRVTKNDMSVDEIRQQFNLNNGQARYLYSQLPN